MATAHKAVLVLHGASGIATDLVKVNVYIISTNYFYVCYKERFHNNCL